MYLPFSNRYRPQHKEIQKPLTIRCLWTNKDMIARDRRCGENKLNLKLRLLHSGLNFGPWKIVRQNSTKTGLCTKSWHLHIVRMISNNRFCWPFEGKHIKNQTKVGWISCLHFQLKAIGLKWVAQTSYANEIEMQFLTKLPGTLLRLGEAQE